MTQDITSLIEKLEGADNRFWRKVSKGAENECWPWTGYKNDRGYGVIRLSKTAALKAHRVAYALAKGPIPEGLLICHSCDNPPCCNPSHLWVGTHTDNNRDRQNKGRTVTVFTSDYAGPRPHGENHGSARLSETQARQILARTESGAELAKEYGVNESTISRLRLGKTWTHLRAQSEAR